MDASINLPPANRKRLAALLAERSYEDREVVLASGKKSNYYLDGRQTSLHPEGIYLAGRLLHAAILRGGAVDGVGGPTLGADPLVSAVALISHLLGDPIPAFIIRKEPKGHGTGAWIEGAKNLPNNAAVALVEDTVTTGKSVLEAARRVEEAGYRVVRIVSLVDREEGGTEAITGAGYDYEPLFRISEVRDARSA